VMAASKLVFPLPKHPETEIKDSLYIARSTI
ncbi:MAG: hypothetical protein ACI945_000415, partial [Pseudohongiellaceae bacterium]